MTSKKIALHLPGSVGKIVGIVEKAIPTMQLKTVSASRAGNKIQARVTWIEDDQPQLGYVSLPLSKGKLAGTLNPITLVEQSFRLRKRAKEEARIITSNQLATGHEIMNEVYDALTVDNPTLASLHPLCLEIVARMKKVIRDGGHTTARAQRNQKRGRKILAAALDYALGFGISDDEAREMLKEAIVRNTMES